MTKEVSNSTTSRDVGAASKASLRKHINLSKKGGKRSDTVVRVQVDHEESEQEPEVMIPIKEALHLSKAGSPDNRAAQLDSFERSGSRGSVTSPDLYNRTWYKRERPSFKQDTSPSPKTSI